MKILKSDYGIEKLCGISYERVLIEFAMHIYWGNLSLILLLGDRGNKGDQGPMGLPGPMVSRYFYFWDFIIKFHTF